MKSLKAAFWSAAVATTALLLTASQALAESYGYDNLGRLVSVTYDNGVTITYQYDNAGNRTVQSVTGGKVVVLPIAGFTIIPVQ